MKAVNAIRMGGVDVLPLVEGGKGIGVSNGISSGHWAAAGGAGTFSAVNADSYDENGEPIPQVYHGRTRRERHEELVDYAIRGGIAQAQQAHELAGGQGRIHANILWEMGGAERVITGVLEGAQGADPRPDLRRRHALSAVRHRGEVRRLLLPDRLLGARLQRAVEARLFARRRPCWAASSTRIPGSPAAITACPTARTRSSPRTRSRACSRCAS